MKLVFMGTPDYAVCSLDALARAGHEIAAVFTREDKPKNRGMKLLPTPVKARAEELGAPVFQPKSLKKGQCIEDLRRISPDIIVVAAYGLILPPQVLELPKYGCVNVHASLLPSYRGSSPINAAILNGDEKTGVTIIQMDSGVDTGDMLLWEETPIGERETVGQLHDRIAELGGRLIVEALELIEKGEARPVKQPEEGSYAHKVMPRDCLVTFDGEAAAVARKIRAYDPFPGAYAVLGGGKVKLFGAGVLESRGDNTPGIIESCDKKGAVISCGAGKIVVEQIQGAGGKKMPCDAFFRGRPQLIGERFGERFGE